MSGKRWTLDEISWDRFDVSKVEPDVLKVVKAAAMVEFNGGDYATYLCNVFNDDEAFKAAAHAWAEEEVQHGQALGMWAQIADPEFDFNGAFARFTDSFSLDLETDNSVRGSRAGELVARCIVEVGTSSYYSALGEATDEPVLKEICKRIAADELRHYKLFYSYLKHYLDKERIGRVRRALVALGRMGETEDDELACAYWAANAEPDESFDRKRWSRAYFARAARFYQPKHVERAVAMTMKAAGLNPQSRLTQPLSHLACFVIQSRARLPEAA